MKLCETCSHWNNFGSSNPNLGECKEQSPKMSGFLLMFRSDFFRNMSPTVQNQSTLWPVTGKNQECDQWTD